MTPLQALSPPDWLALGWFVACWLGYAWLADSTPLYRRSVSAAMSENRRRWMRTMLTREMRMVDTTIQSSLIHGVAFFASTSIFVVGGLVAMLGATDQAIAVLRDLPFAAPTTRPVWEMKLLFLIVIFVYAFFKFVWAFRLFNYCSILIGGAPLVSGTPSERELAHVDRIATLNTRAAAHFNRGVRAYSFALALLGWFINPWVFIAATTWVTLVLQRREFRSMSRMVMLPEVQDAAAEADAAGRRRE